MQPVFDLTRYNERLESLFTRFQSVQKVGFTGNAYKPGLEGMERFSAMLGDPWKSYPCIHVAGTNGKGSVCSMLAAALAADGSTASGRFLSGPVRGGSDDEAGGSAVSGSFLSGPVRGGSGADRTATRKIGLYTSPHLLDFRERMKIVSADGYEMISREEVWNFLNEYEPTLDGLSFFEITTGMALWWFAKKKVDAAIIEVGLGGRLDSTNIITPALSVVTSIGLDHCALLGSTRAAIACEKAGIFKAGVPAVVGIRDPETELSFKTVAFAMGTPLIFASDRDAFEGEEALLAQMDLTGPCQDINLHTVLVALEAFGYKGWSRDGIASCARLTGFQGRWQRICEAPETICDIGHNPPALKENFARIRQMQEEGRSAVIVYGIMADKDLDGIAPLMPAGARYILAAPDNQRALPAEDLLQRLSRLRPDLDCSAAGSVQNAVRQALDLAQDLPNPFIYIGGSTFVVAEALPLFNESTTI